MSGFDDASALHDHDLVGALAGDGEIVGDEEDAHPGLGAQLVEEVEDLLLDGDVEGGSGFIGDEQARTQRDGGGNEHPLPHPARELVRELIGPLLRLVDADPVQQLDDLSTSLCPVGSAVDAQRLGDGFPDRLQRIERGPWVLWDIADLGTAHTAPPGGAQAEQIEIAEADPPVRDPGRWREQADGRVRRRRLPRTGFPDHGGHRTGTDHEVEFAHGRCRGAASAGVFDGETVDAQQ